MIPVALTSSTSIVGIRITFKYSKGFQKCIKIGAEKYTGEKLTIIMRSTEGDRYSLKVDEKRNSLYLSQDPNGNIILKITEDLYLPGQNSEPENYIWFEGKRRLMVGGAKTLRYFIPLILVN